MLPRALAKRRGLIESGVTSACRAFCGGGDGIDGVYIDVYGEGATLNVHEGVAPARFDAVTEAQAVLAALRPLGVRAVYVKPFVKDRSSLGGVLPAEATSPTPAAGEALPEAVLIREYGLTLEVRLWDGLSTGLFLDQRENRRFVAEWVTRRTAENAAKGRPTPTVLNTFAYTCGFSAAAARAGAVTASVDVSGRYLEWGKRNFAHNGLDAAAHRFAKMDTFEFLGYAKRKGLAYDLIVLDPPSYAAGSKKKGVRAWSAEADYARLVREAVGVLRQSGLVLASTNTRALCMPGRLEREIEKGLGRPARWVKLPDQGMDCAAERGRFAARAFGA